ncbi:MAG: rod shape-determining protein MreC [Pseudomonadota bacterium]
MATPDKRRLGFNRKAHYRAFTGYVLAILGGFTGLFLLVLSYVDPTGFSVLRGAASEATAPVSGTLASASSGSRNSWQEIAAYFDAGSKNAALQRELEDTRNQLVEARALKQENQRLRRLLDLLESEPEPVTLARLISSSATSSRRYATMGAGSRQGVERGQPVRSPKGLIGRVIETTPNTARVLLLTDPRNVVPVKRASDGVVAFTEGLGNGDIAIRLINVGVNPFEQGDILVTSGSGGLYRPNIPVAVIRKTTSDGALATLLSDPAAADFVMVQRVYLPDIVDADGGETPASADNDDAEETTSGNGSPQNPVADGVGQSE